MRAVCETTTTYGAFLTSTETLCCLFLVPLYFLLYFSILAINSPSANINSAGEAFSITALFQVDSSVNFALLLTREIEVSAMVVRCFSFVPSSLLIHVSRGWPDLPVGVMFIHLMWSSWSVWKRSARWKIPSNTDLLMNSSWESQGADANDVDNSLLCDEFLAFYLDSFGHNLGSSTDSTHCTCHLSQGNGNTTCGISELDNLELDSPLDLQLAVSFIFAGANDHCLA